MSNLHTKFEKREQRKKPLHNLDVKFIAHQLANRKRKRHDYGCVCNFLKRNKTDDRLLFHGGQMAPAPRILNNTMS